ncbi:MAG: sugar transferase [Bacteroidota bacterium]|nr:sugar transferase [Bacteroidota bacterium]
MNKSRLFLKYILYDMLASLLVWVAFVIFRKTVNDIQVFDGVRILFPNYDYLTSLLIFPFSCVFVHYLSGFYLNLLKKSRISVVFSTISSSAIISLSVFLVLKLGDVIVSYEYFYFSLLVLFGLLFCFTFLFRNIVFSQIQHNFRIKKWTFNTLIIGTGDNAKKMADDLEKYAPKNTLIGFIATNKKVGVPAESILGNMSQLAYIIEKHEIHETIVVLDEDADEKQLFKIINLLYKFNIDIQFTPRLYEILIGSAKMSHMGTIPLVSITNPSMADWEISVKRFSDIVISLLSLALLSPFLFYFMFQIKRDSKGAVFYRQERIGRFGRPFNILKFRTMYTGSENGTPKLSSANDDRVTKVGRTMRKYRIDEIPQFWNILKGDMSLVGPRPERRYYINHIIEDAPYYCLLYKIRPGLTSWGPIKIGYSDTIEKMIERLNYDIIYMENMSLFTDIKILIYTIEIIFKGKGV